MNRPVVRSMFRSMIRSIVASGRCCRLPALPLVCVLAILSLSVPVRAALADNAAFAIAPRETSLAIDARRLSEILVGARANAVRPVIEAVAGAEMLRAFDMLAVRSGTAADKAATEIFSGRVAFFLDEFEAARPPEPDGGGERALGPVRDSAWILGLEADDARCERVLKLFGARITQPGRYEAPREGLAMQRVGGWLLVGPSSSVGRAALERAVRRTPVEDAGMSLLGEPLLQDLLVSDAPIRIFLRHGAPIGGASTLAFREVRGSLFAEVHGNYEASPLGGGGAVAPLDLHLVRAFEDRAAFVVSNPSDGRAGTSDLFWTALVPELAPSPAMRANLAGERLLAIGERAKGTEPLLALAWRIDDAEQGQSDQDHLMRAVCCGMARANELPPGLERPAAKGEAAGVGVESAASDPEAPDPADESTPLPPLGPGQLALLEMRRCAEFGAFLDRYLGRSFKLGGTLLCWSTVSTPCGGWQVYASDPQWLGEVSERLAAASCSPDVRPRTAGIGFCDGPRAASLLRRWRPLVDVRAGAVAPESRRVAAGLEALASAMERFGRMRFQYATPNDRRMHLVVEFEAIGTMATPAEAGAGMPKAGRP